MRRTRLALVRALVALVLRKRYDAITIQDLLDQADVSRSTFYAHYRGKDDLLLTSFGRMLEGLDRQMELTGPTTRVAPVRELFEHVWRARAFHQALARARVLDRQHQSRVALLSGIIERRLVARQRRAARPVAVEARVPIPVLAQALAGSLLTLLRWWVEQGAPCSPAAMDDMYHALWSAGV